jgi:septum formation protein
LLSRLAIPFEILAPDVDETRLPGEPPEELVQRLSEAKARAGAAQFPDALVIGSDQVAVVDGEVLGKPGDHERAVEQLRKLSGKTVVFLTGLCLYNAASGEAQTRLVPFRVRFRVLDDGRIERYLRHEQPYNCAGSFKSEALGITLFERMEGEDPTALIGLPLITLTTLLAQAGVVLP